MVTTMSKVQMKRQPPGCLGWRRCLNPKSWGATISFHDIWGFQTLRGSFSTTTMAVWALIDRTQHHTGWQRQALSSGKCSPCIYDMLANSERGWHFWLPSAWYTRQRHCASRAVAVWVCCSFSSPLPLMWTLTSWKTGTLSVSSLISASAKALAVAWPEADTLLCRCSSGWCTLICLWCYVAMRRAISLIVSPCCVFHFEVEVAVPISWSWRVLLLLTWDCFIFLSVLLWKDDQRCKGGSAHSCATVTHPLSLSPSLRDWPICYYVHYFTAFSSFWIEDFTQSNRACINNEFYPSAWAIVWHCGVPGQTVFSVIEVMFGATYPGCVFSWELPGSWVEEKSLMDWEQ